MRFEIVGEIEQIEAPVRGAFVEQRAQFGAALPDIVMEEFWRFMTRSRASLEPESLEVP